VCFVVHKTISELERVILTTLFLLVQKNTDSWRTRKGDLQCTFPLDVPMVTSSALAITGDSEHLSCGGFSLDETIHFGSLEFIADYFGGLSLSPWRDCLDAAVMGSTCSGPPSPLRAMIGDSTEEFHMTLDGEGGDRPPPSQKVRHGDFAHPYQNHIMAREHSDHLGYGDDFAMAGSTTAGHRSPFLSDACAHQEGKRAQAHAQPPCTKQEATQCWNELASRQVATVA
jgi:hypothetical protein